MNLSSGCKWMQTCHQMAVEGISRRLIKAYQWYIQGMAVYSRYYLGTNWNSETFAIIFTRLLYQKTCIFESTKRLWNPTSKPKMPSRHKGQPTARPSLDVLLSADATCPIADQLSFRASPGGKHGKHLEVHSIEMKLDQGRLNGDYCKGFKTAIEFDSLMGPYGILNNEIQWNTYVHVKLQNGTESWSMTNVLLDLEQNFDGAQSTGGGIHAVCLDELPVEQEGISPPESTWPACIQPICWPCRMELTTLSGRNFV